jgi:hypothetical protein
MGQAIEYLVIESETTGWLIRRDGYPIALRDDLIEAIEVANQLAEEETALRRQPTVVRLDADSVRPRLSRA